MGWPLEQGPIIIVLSVLKMPCSVLTPVNLYSADVNLELLAFLGVAVRRCRTQHAQLAKAYQIRLPTGHLDTASPNASFMSNSDTLSRVQHAQ